MITEGYRLITHSELSDLSNDDHSQYLLSDGSRPISGINGLNYGNGIAENIDLITVNEDSADANKPRLWWNEATDSFETNKSLTLPGSSLKIGNYKLSENTVDGDGLEKIGSFHILPNEGIAGNICLHEGMEPTCSGHGDGHRLWVDATHNLKWQNESGVSKTIGAAFTEVDPVFVDWDRSTGISITESQISDLQNYLTSEIDPVFSAWESSFTQGSIIFADDTGLIENNANLFWDNVNKRLAIGLADPARMIHMQGRNATFRIDRDTNSPAVQMHHFPTGDFTIPLKGFIFGVSAAGADDGIFFISDFHQAVGGGGDNRFTIENDGKITIPGALDIGGIISGDGSGLTNLAETDPVFMAWDKNSGISITESQISDLLHTPAFDGDIPEIYNSLGLFKIQPDAQGDVELFGDTDVDNAENSRIFKMWRRAAEGNDYIRFYISAGRKAYIHASQELTLQSQNPFTINSVTDDIFFKVGDNAGVKKFYFQDSDNNDLMKLDSDGKLSFGGVTADEMVHLLNGNIRLESDSGDLSLLFTDNDDDNTLGFIFDKSEEVLSVVGGMNGDRTPSFLDAIMTFTRSFRVGIKKRDPTCELDVNGDVNIDGDFSITGTVDGIDIADLNTLVTTKAPKASPVFTGNAVFDTDTLFVDSVNKRIGIRTNTPHDDVHIVSSSPFIIFEESDAGSGEKVWEIGANNEEFVLKTANDLYSGTQTVFKAAGRGGTSVTEFSIPNANVAIGTDVVGDSPLKVAGLTQYSDNAAAISAGLTVGEFYRNGASTDKVCVVH